MASTISLKKAFLCPIMAVEGLILAELVLCPFWYCFRVLYRSSYLSQRAGKTKRKECAPSHRCCRGQAPFSTSPTHTMWSLLAAFAANNCEPNWEANKANRFGWSKVPRPRWELGPVLWIRLLQYPLCLSNFVCTAQPPQKKYLSH